MKLSDFIILLISLCKQLQSQHIFVPAPGQNPNIPPWLLKKISKKINAQFNAQMPTRIPTSTYAVDRQYFGPIMVDFARTKRPVVAQNTLGPVMQTNREPLNPVGRQDPRVPVRGPIPRGPVDMQNTIAPMARQKPSGAIDMPSNREPMGKHHIGEPVGGRNYRGPVVEPNSRVPVAEPNARGPVVEPNARGHDLISFESEIKFMFCICSVPIAERMQKVSCMQKFIPAANQWKMDLTLQYCGYLAQSTNFGAGNFNTPQYTPSDTINMICDHYTKVSPGKPKTSIAESVTYKGWMIGKCVLNLAELYGATVTNMNRECCSR